MRGRRTGATVAATVCTVAVFAYGAPAKAALVFDLVTGAPTAQSLVVDSNQCPAQGPVAMYVAGTIANTGPIAAADVQASISGLSGQFALTGSQSATITIGALAAGASVLVGWHVTYPCTDGTVRNVTISATGSTGSDSDAIALTVRAAQSANAGGNVMATTLGAGAVVGQTITADVRYDFGNINTGNEFFLQPAGNTGFDAACLQLVGSEITASNINAIPVGAANDLYFVSPNKQTGNGYTATVRYSFRYLCAGATSVARPYAVQTSGASNIKYTGNYDGTGALNFDFPTATNPFTISKSVSSPLLLAGAGPHQVTYTVAVSNPSAFASRIDGFDDVLPAGVAFTALHASSGVAVANSAATPATGATGTISFDAIYGSSYAIPAGGSLTLVYTASVQDAAGAYQNSASARIGTATVGPATALTTVASAELSVTKSVAAHAPGGYAVPGAEVVYTIRVENSGLFAVDSNSLVVVDQMPVQAAFNSGDFAPGGAVSPFEFNTGAAALTCCASGDVDFSDSGGPPPTYGYAPSTGFDQNVRYIRINPKGALQPGEAFEVRFRARIE